jgi:hypothetical protein
MEVLKAKQSPEKISLAVNAIIDELGEPKNSLHELALNAFKRGDYDYVKDLAAIHLNDFYCKCLGRLVEIYSSQPNIALILAESGTAAADFVREKALIRLGAVNAKIL